MTRTSPFLRVSIYVLLLLIAIAYLVPVYVMANQGFKTYEEVNRETMWDLPSRLTLSSWSVAWEKLAPNMRNSLAMAIPATIISAILGALNGYILSKWKFRGSELIFTLILFGMFIPYQTVLIPLVLFLQKIKLYSTIPGLILVHVVYGIPIPALIFRNYFAGIPDDIIDAALVDGAGLLGIFRHIILPLAVPGFVVVSIFQFTNIWNDFLFGVVVIPRQVLQPVMVAVYNLAGSFVVEWNVQMAGAIIAALPTLVVYIVLGRYFIRGLLASSLKEVLPKSSPAPAGLLTIIVWRAGSG